MEANDRFSFIDASWIPEGPESISYTDENVKEVLNLVKKHALLHPLIPINKEISLPRLKFIAKASQMQTDTAEEKILFICGHTYGPTGIIRPTGISLHGLLFQMRCR